MDKLDIFKVDKNFLIEQEDQKDVEYFSAREIEGALYGVFYDESRSIYCRMPDELSRSVSEWVHYNARCTAGGRLRIETDSPYITLRAIEPKEKVASSMTPTAQFGFTIEEGHLYHGDVSPTLWDEYVTKADSEYFVFQGTRHFAPNKQLRSLTIHFPMYNTVNELYVGVKKGSILRKAKDYKYKTPIVFYGSSIEQGASASRPGNDYVSTVCKWLGSDYLNMGFSGACRGEKIMAEYLASLNASAYVIAYDYNAGSVEHYENTHYQLYKIIREKNANTPILFTTRANVTINSCMIDGKKIFFSEPYSSTADCEVNRFQKVALETYEKAKADGDKNVFFLGGEKLYGDEDGEMNNSDHIHPNDLGFYKMAKAVYPIVKKMIETK